MCSRPFFFGRFKTDRTPQFPYSFVLRTPTPLVRGDESFARLAFVFVLRCLVRRMKVSFDMRALHRGFEWVFRKNPCVLVSRKSRPLWREDGGVCVIFLSGLWHASSGNIHHKILVYRTGRTNPDHGQAPSGQHGILFHIQDR